MALNLTDAPEDDDNYPPAYRELVEPTQPSPKAIRAWAKATGLYVGTRGRIPADVELAYNEARQA